MDTPTSQADDVYRMPYEERETDGRSPEESLFDALGSEPEFQETEEPEAVDEPEAEVEEEADADEAEEVEETDEAEESDEDDDVDEGGEEEPDTPTYTVKVDGKEVKVTLDELLAGYSRTADYTRKTQELAQQRKQIEGEVQGYREAREQYSARLQQLEQVLESLQPPEPDWDRLRQEDPAEFAAQWAEHQRLRAAREAAAAERARIEQERLIEQQRELAARLEEERERLKEAVPEWRDDVKRTEAMQALTNYARTTYGFTDDDLAQVYDHRVLLILRKAMLYDELTTKGVEQVRAKKRAAKVLKPGARKAPAKNSELRAMRKRLAQSGRDIDAAALIERALLD